MTTLITFKTNEKNSRTLSWVRLKLTQNLFTELKTVYTLNWVDAKSMYSYLYPTGRYKKGNLIPSFQALQVLHNLVITLGRDACRRIFTRVWFEIKKNWKQAAYQIDAPPK